MEYKLQQIKIKLQQIKPCSSKRNLLQVCLQEAKQRDFPFQEIAQILKKQNSSISWVLKLAAGIVLFVALWSNYENWNFYRTNFSITKNAKANYISNDYDIKLPHWENAKKYHYAKERNIFLYYEI